MQPIQRRRLLAAGAACSLGAARLAHSAPQFRLKIATDAVAVHPVTTGLQACARQIAADSNGRVELAVYHSGQLGSGPQFLSQLRTGSLELCVLSSVVLGIFVPSTPISGLAFAFNNYDEVWKALDGDLGGMMRRDIRKAGLHVFERMWDVGFRQITSTSRVIEKPEDLKNFHIRVPPSPLWTSLFAALGAAPVTVQMAELYSALQTKVVEGQENPISVIEAAKLDEVQKRCALTHHMWDGVHLLAHRPTWAALPAEVQELIAKTFDSAALAQRAEVQRQNETLIGTLKTRGMGFTEPNRQAFREALRKAGFYNDWKAKFPKELWAGLEKYVGVLA